MATKNWYVVHTYAGFENKVKTNILETVATLGLQEKISQILARLETVDSLLFVDLFDGSTSKIQVIGTFLALLELIKTRVIKAVQIEQFGAIRIMKAVIETRDRDTATGNLFG